jgi:hypothetical protein
MHTPDKVRRKGALRAIHDREHGYGTEAPYNDPYLGVKNRPPRGTEKGDMETP